MKIVVLDGYMLNPGDFSWEPLKKLGDVTVYDRTPKDPKVIAKRIGDSEIVIVNKTMITKEILDQTPQVKYIGVTATGYNVIDIKAASEKNIIVTNIPTYGTKSVAQYVFALLLELCHHVGDHNQSVQEGNWASCPDFSYWNSPLIELSGKTLGIIGFGKIGQAVSEIALAFSMNVLVYTLDFFETNNANIKLCTLDTLYEQSDVITLHVPLNDLSFGMINKHSISKMKDGVMIINTARGQLIIEDDLLEAVKSKKVYAAALDVVATEPIGEDNVLLKEKNIIITPHIAWATYESRKRLFDATVANIEHFLNHNPIHVVNVV